MIVWAHHTCAMQIAKHNEDETGKKSLIIKESFNELSPLEFSVNLALNFSEVLSVNATRLFK